MRKVLFGLSAILMCVLLASCGNPMSRLESIVDDMTENGKEYDSDQWESVLRDVADLQLSFWESEPSSADIKEFDKLGRSFEKAIDKAMKSKKSLKAFEKAYKALDKDKEFKKLIKDGEKAEKKARKAAKKSAKDEEDDEDEEDEEDDDE
jgi:hypothetical protein